MLSIEFNGKTEYNHTNGLGLIFAEIRNDYL